MNYAALILCAVLFFSFTEADAAKDELRAFLKDQITELGAGDDILRTVDFSTVVDPGRKRDLDYLMSQDFVAGEIKKLGPRVGQWVDRRELAAPQATYAQPVTHSYSVAQPVVQTYRRELKPVVKAWTIDYAQPVALPKRRELAYQKFHEGDWQRRELGDLELNWRNIPIHAERRKL